jgi:PE family
MQRCVDDVAGVAMSFVVAVPEFVSSAASDLSNIGSGLSAAHAAAAGPTTAVMAAAGDQVSAAVASLFPGTGRPISR